MRRAAAELREQMRAQRRRRFRSPVALRIELFAVDLERPPGTPPSVKAYLDLLQGLAYDDDRDVHLVHPPVTPQIIRFCVMTTPDGSGIRTFLGFL